MAADIQHADALRLVQHLEQAILETLGYVMTYSDAANVLGRPAKDGRHIGQVISRIDAACFYAKVPFLGMHRVRETYGGAINPRSFSGDLWAPHVPAIIARAEKHAWTAEDFKRIKSALHSMGEDSAALQWERIERHGQKAVQRALGT